MAAKINSRRQPMRMLRIKAFSFFLLILLVLASGVHGSAQIVQNGNFAAGGTDWTTTQTNNDYPWGFVTDGTYGTYASTGCIGQTCITGPDGEQANLFQDLTTVPGDSYTLSFEYNPADGTPTELEALFGGTVATDLVDVPNNNGLLVTYTISGLVATSSSTQLEFLGRQDPSYNVLTDVSVVQGGPSVPEGGASLLYLLMAAAVSFGAMAYVSRGRFGSSLQA
jgi:hypothetical protein